MMKFRHCQLQSRSGFTLIELIVAIALLAMLSAALLGSLRTGVRVWAHISKAADQTEETIIAERFIEKAISQSYPLFDRSDPAHATIRFVGDQNNLQLVTVMPRALGSAGLALIT